MPDQGTIRFGLFVADLRGGALKKGQDRIPLQNLPFRILTLLLREPGRVITREELRQQLWPENTFVDFERGISTAVSKLRDALGDSATNPRFIETVGRRGYRFIAPVSVATEERRAVSASPQAGTAQAAAQPVDTPREPVLGAGMPLSSRGRRKRLVIYYGLVGVACLVSAFGIFKSWQNRIQPATAAGQREIRSIAVLPLRNLSGDSQQDYLSDGLTEAVTTLLAQISDLRVISGTTAMHYKHAEKTTPEIAKELGVDALVEGSVVRSGNRLRLSVQLVQTKNDAHIWASTYERELENVVSLEGELSREIAGQIRIRLTPEQIERFAEKRAVDPEAYALYLQGRYYWHQRNEESLTKSIGYFEQAIARDPNFSPAYAGLADAYLVMQFFGPSKDRYDREGYERAGIAAEKALALDPRSAEARNSEAYVRLYRDWDFKGAEHEFKQALALNPNHATAHQWYAELLTMEGRSSEAIVEINRGLELDSQSAIMHHQAGQVLNAARQYPQALAEYTRSLELDPKLYANYFGMYQAYRRMGDFEHAIPLGAVHARFLGKDYQKAFAEAAHIFATQGKEAFLRKSLGLWAKSHYWGATVGQAWDYGELHEYDKCLQVLEREYQRHNLAVVDAFDPEFDGLRADPRFQQFLHKVGVR